MKPKSKIILIIIHSFIPILIGAFIYICYRKTSLLLFDWLEKISMSEFVIYIREYVNPENILYSNWVTHNLPDALWVYAYTSFFIILYGLIVNKRTIFIFLIPVLIAITSEFLQLTYWEKVIIC